MRQIEIRKLSAKDVTSYLAELTQILLQCVRAGASVSFVLPISNTQSELFWSEKIAKNMQSEDFHLYGAFDEGQLAGTVYLDCDLPANQPHRGDVGKLLVHPDHRRKGIARQLMEYLLTDALQLDKSLLVLDTQTGSAAEGLYRSLGFETVGQIPDFALDASGDVLEPTTVMYKKLSL